MKFIDLALNGAFIIEPEPVVDSRGSFSRVFCKNELCEVGHFDNIAQINHSINQKSGTIRGLHFQIPPSAEIKIVKCIKGAIFDVIVDIRKGSSTFLKWYGEELSSENMKMMYIPKGFAHGFQTLRHESELIYVDTAFYSPDHEGALRFNDPILKINWPLPVSNISERDCAHPLIGKTFKGMEV